jgi:hypothetical protein
MKVLVLVVTTTIIQVVQVEVKELLELLSVKKRDVR